MDRSVDPSTSWCLLRSNEILRGLLLSIANDKGLDWKQLGELCDGDQHHVRKYFQGEHTLSQYKVVKLAKALGIEVSLDITFKL